MASHFLSEVPGVNQARVVDPSGFVPVPDGEAAFVLGDNIPGFTRRLVPGDGMDVHQSPAVGDGKLIRFRGRIRGTDAAPPLVSSLLEPYALTDGDTITVRLDGGAAQVITFDAADFVSIGAASAVEVRDAINAQLVGGVARLNGIGGIEIRTNKRGRRARAFLHTGTAPLGLEEWAWFAIVTVDGTEHARVEIRPGETRDLSDLAASLAVGGSPEIRFSLKLGTK